MDLLLLLLAASAAVPVVLMSIAALLPLGLAMGTTRLWRSFGVLSVAALLGTLVSLAWHWATPGAAGPLSALAWFRVTVPGACLAVLVQLLGTIVGAFSSRYLQGEPAQRRYAIALGCVLAAVHLLLLADHWVVLIAAWAAVGVALQHLLCFYRDRPFAVLAAQKKRIADRLADAMLLCAAVLAWREAGSGSLSELWQHLAQGADSMELQLSALCLVLAVILRTALFPVHGWLIQVMEAPTPVSALLHAGVVNLGGFVLIRFAPLLETAPAARWLLVVFGLGTSVLAGLVMLTRISIKVRLAWSTVAQMGFMVLECGLGLYTLAVLHLIGHSLYKAHAFLSASSTVRQTKLQMMRGNAAPSAISVAAAPALGIGAVVLVQLVVDGAAWPWWWSGVLALAWAPLLWLPAPRAGETLALGSRGLAGLGMVVGLTGVVCATHAVPLGVMDAPHHPAGVFTLLGMTVMYLCLAALQLRPRAVAAWRRWSYAGFYVDEFYTRLALRIWPTLWTPVVETARDRRISGAAPTVASR